MDLKGLRFTLHCSASSLKCHVQAGALIKYSLCYQKKNNHQWLCMILYTSDCQQINHLKRYFQFTCMHCKFALHSQHCCKGLHSIYYLLLRSLIFQSNNLSRILQSQLVKIKNFLQVCRNNSTSDLMTQASEGISIALLSTEAC